MPLVKTQAEGINLADTFAFTGTVSGVGKVLQVVSSHVTSQHSTSTTGEEDITDMNVTITPSSTSSKILVLAQMVVGSGQDTGNHFTLKRGSTAIGVGSTSGSRTQVSPGS